MEDRQSGPFASLDQSAALSPMANAVVHVFERKETVNNEPKIIVNRFLSEIASWYEKFRTAMDIREDEVVLRNAIERILKRRVILGGKGDKIAGPLLRELIWARYFPTNSIPESMIGKVAHTINLYMALQQNVLLGKKIKESQLADWTYQMMSAHVSKLLAPNVEKNTVSNFMYHILKDSLTIQDDTVDTKNVQVYLAVRRAFAKDDVAFLRFYLFEQIFGTLTDETLENTQKNFIAGYTEIEKQLNYPLKTKIFMFAKKQTPVFFILEDVLREKKKELPALLEDEEKLREVVFLECEKRYKNIKGKVRTAIIRSVVFLLVTKAVLALGVEGSYERWRYGHVMWNTIAINTGIPPLLMIVVSLFIKTPGKDNTERIFAKIKQVLFETDPKITPSANPMVHPPKNHSILSYVLVASGLFAFVVSFGFIIWILTKLHFNILSQFIFIFFITVVSFLSYRINSTAQMYSIDGKQALLTPLVDLFIIPIVRVGMYLTEGISQINVIIFIFDFIIEAPFKALFGFFEQFFSYLQSKREDLG